MEIHLSGLCDVRRAENDAKRSVKPHTVRHREIGLNLSAVGYSLGWVSAVESRGPNSLEERRKVEKLEATLACLAATLKEQAVQPQRRSAQLEASKPAPRVANNPRAASAPTKKNQFTISRPNTSTGQVVMFGGLADVNPNNTWTYDGTTWTLQSPAVQPLLVYAASAAFDPGLQGVVLFRGGSGGVDQNTTWLWDQVGATWTLLSTPQSPPAREGAGMTYDAALHHVILFGGQDNNGYFNDTWKLISTPTPTPSLTPTPTATPTLTPSATPAPRATPTPRPRPQPRPRPLQ